MSKKKKSKKENIESVNLENNFHSMVCLYGPPKDLKEKLKIPTEMVKLYGPPNIISLRFRHGGEKITNLC